MNLGLPQPTRPQLGACLTAGIPHMKPYMESFMGARGWGIALPNTVV